MGGAPSVYWKIDVEGASMPCLRSLARMFSSSPDEQPGEKSVEGHEMPQFLSVEAPDVMPELDEALELLERLGYRHFKLMDQTPYCLAPNPQHLGCGSGLFGKQAVDVVTGPTWRSAKEVRVAMLRCIQAMPRRGIHVPWNTSLPEADSTSPAGRAHRR